LSLYLLTGIHPVPDVKLCKVSSVLSHLGSNNFSRNQARQPAWLKIPEKNTADLEGSGSCSTYHSVMDMSEGKRCI